MKLDITCRIEVPHFSEEVSMTPKELLKFHDDLTKFINENWEALNQEDEEDNKTI